MGIHRLLEKRSDVLFTGTLCNQFYFITNFEKFVYTIYSTYIRHLFLLTPAPIINLSIYF